MRGHNGKEAMRYLIVRALVTAAWFATLTGSAAADQSAPAVAPSPQTVQGLAARVPATLVRTIRRDPAVFAMRVADLILSQREGGTKDGAAVLTPAAIDVLIQVRRATARARAAEVILRGDLDGDGTVARPELDALLAATSTARRASVDAAWRAADANGDGRADPGEVRNYAERRAGEKVGEAEENKLRILMVLDLDGDGRLSLSELRRSVEILTDAPGAKSQAGQGA